MSPSWSRARPRSFHLPLCMWNPANRCLCETWSWWTQDVAGIRLGVTVSWVTTPLVLSSPCWLRCAAKMKLSQFGHIQELANFIQKESGRQVSVSISPSGTVTSAAAAGGRAPEHRVIITTAGNTDPNRQVRDSGCCHVGCSAHGPWRVLTSPWVLEALPLSRAWKLELGTVPEKPWESVKARHNTWKALKIRVENQSELVLEKPWKSVKTWHSAWKSFCGSSPW